MGYGCIEESFQRNQTDMEKRTLRSLLRPGCSAPTRFQGTSFLRKNLSESPQNPRNCVVLDNRSVVHSQKESFIIIGSLQFTNESCSKLVHKLMVWNLE
jgi:hypothetical protein